MSDERFNLLRVGEHNDLGNNKMTVRGVAEACIDGHTIRRTVTVGEDQVLSLNHKNQLTVETKEFVLMKEVGDLHCDCGEQFRDHKGALEHLLKAKRGEL